MKTTCIMCPLGCELEILSLPSGEVKVSGHTCVRGENYGKTELTKPMRNVSSLARVGEGVVAVKTTGPIPKAKINEVLKEIGKINLSSFPPIGTVLIKNILGLGVDVVAIGI